MFAIQEAVIKTCKLLDQHTLLTQLVKWKSFVNIFFISPCLVWYVSGEQSLEAYGLESLTGSEGEVTVYEDMQKVCKGYKLGDDIPFTATYKGKFDKAVQSSVSSAGGDSAADDVVDVEAEVVAE